MTTRSIFLSRHVLCFLASTLIIPTVWGANSPYLALFSAEHESHRRILIDGIGDRRVQMRLDSLGQAEIRVWGVEEEAYVGRRSYEKGYLVPVTIRVDFPRKSLMSIKVTGTLFRDFVTYKLIDSDIYIVDLFTRTLPHESYFREETISAFWPSGRFNPDITPKTPSPELSEEKKSKPVSVSRTLTSGMVPYRRVIRRAVVWAGGLSCGLLLVGVPLIWYVQRRKSLTQKTSPAQKVSTAKGIPPTITDPRVRALMTLNGSLSYDEASLLSAIGNEKYQARRRRLS